MKYKIKFTKSFKKAYKSAIKRGLDVADLYNVIDKLSKGEVLDEKSRDHQLNKSKHFNNVRECHINPDWLLIYIIDKNELILTLVDTGTHSDLFK